MGSAPRAADLNTGGNGGDGCCYFPLHIMNEWLPRLGWRVLVVYQATYYFSDTSGDARFSLDDLAGLMGLRPKTIEAHLRRLLDAGLVIRREANSYHIPGAAEYAREQLEAGQ